MTDDSFWIFLTYLLLLHAVIKSSQTKNKKCSDWWMIYFLIQFKFDLNKWVILVCCPSKTLQIFRRSLLKPSDMIDSEFRWRIVSCHLDCTVVNLWDTRAVRLNTSLAFAKWPHKVERSKIYCGVDWRPGVKAQNQQWAAGKRPISRSLKPSIVWPL